MLEARPFLSSSISAFSNAISLLNCFTVFCSPFFLLALFAMHFLDFPITGVCFVEIYLHNYFQHSSKKKVNEL